MDVPKFSAPNHYPFWRKRTNGGPGSVIQSLLCRELGLPKYKEGAEVVSSSYNEKIIGRSLLLNRIDETMHDIPVNISLIQTNTSVQDPEDASETERKTTNPDRCIVGWRKVELARGCKLIYFGNGIFWHNGSCTRVWLYPGSTLERGNVDRFYVLNPDTKKGFQKVGETNSFTPGELTDLDVLYEGPCFTNIKRRRSSFLVTLLDVGWIRLHDLLHGRNTEMLLRYSGTGPVGFTEVVVDNNIEEIYVMATRSGKVQAVYVLKYISEFNRLRIEFVLHMGFQAKMEIYKSMAILGSGNYADIFSWKDLVYASEPGPSKIKAVQNVDSDCADLHEHVLGRKPQRLERLKTHNGYLEISTALWPPLFFVKQTVGLNIITKIASLDNLETIWEHTNSSFDSTTVAAFPDESPRFLFCEDMTITCRVITLQRNEKGAVEVDPKSEIFPFAVPEKQKEPTMSEETKKRAREHLQRASTRKVVKPNKSTTIEVLDMEHCSDLDLIAVCSVKEDEDSCVQITLYEAKSLTLFKTLPPLYAWPKFMGSGRQGSTSGKGRYTMRSLTMKFGRDLISISIRYDDSTKDFFFHQLV